MIFKVTMKDPHTLYDAITDAVAGDVGKLPLSVDEKTSIAEIRHEAVSQMCVKWFEYGEYLTVEIDTEAQTCTVVPYK